MQSIVPGVEPELGCFLKMARGLQFLNKPCDGDLHILQIHFGMHNTFTRTSYA